MESAALVFLLPQVFFSGERKMNLSFWQKVFFPEKCEFPEDNVWTNI